MQSDNEVELCPEKYSPLSVIKYSDLWSSNKPKRVSCTVIRDVTSHMFTHCDFWNRTWAHAVTYLTSVSMQWGPAYHRHSPGVLLLYYRGWAKTLKLSVFCHSCHIPTFFKDVLLPANREWAHTFVLISVCRWVCKHLFSCRCLSVQLFRCG